MDINVVTQLITTVGFPIAACVALYLSSRKDAELHKAEIEELSKAITANTAAITELATLIKGGLKNGKE